MHTHFFKGPSFIFITFYRIDIPFPYEKDLIPQAKGTLSCRMRNKTAKTILKGRLFYNTTNFVLIIIDLTLIYYTAWRRELGLELVDVIAFWGWIERE